MSVTTFRAKISLALIIFILDSMPLLARSVTDCDNYAASPYDNGRLGKAVDSEEIDEQKAITACETAVALHPDDPRLQFQLARSYGKAKDFKEAIKWYEMSFNNGFPLSQHNLGIMYLNGNGTEKNSAKGFSLIKDSADRLKLPFSQRILASFYENGEVTSKDLTLAFKYYKMAADAGDPIAQAKAGLAYRDGKGTSKNLKLAFDYFLLSAKQGDVSGEFYVGNMLKNGLGTKKDIAAAVEYYKRAALKGSESADANLASIYMTEPSNVNYNLALIHLRKSLTYSISQVNLGWLYEYGFGVPQNYTKAHMWYNLAASSGNQVGIKNRSSLEKKLLPQQLAIAQELARICKDSKLKDCGEPATNTSSTDKAPKTSIKSEELYTGTAFFINRDGYLLTNNHVINECTTIQIKTSESLTLSAKNIIASKEDDLAVLKVDLSPRDYAEFRLEKSPRQGETVITYGFPLTGLLSSTGNVTSGIITSLTGLGDNTRQMQISTAIQPGNSGGPLVDETGLVVGVVVAKLNALAVSKVTSDIPQNVNFAIRASNATSLLEAKGIAFSVTKQGKKQELTELADKLKKYTALVECKK